MADYIYSVNDQSDSWDGPLVQQYFRNAKRGEDWYLTTCYRQIETGDRIWAYATAPLQQIVAVGYVVDGPYETNRWLPKASPDHALWTTGKLRKRLVADYQYEAADLEGLVDSDLIYLIDIHIGTVFDYAIDIEWDLPRNKKLVDSGPRYLFEPGKAVRS